MTDDTDKLAQIAERWKYLGPWCWMQIGEKCDVNWVGVAISPDDQDASSPLSGLIPERDNGGNTIPYYTEAVCIVEEGTYAAEGAPMTAARAIAAAPEDIATLLTLIAQKDATIEELRAEITSLAAALQFTEDMRYQDAKERGLP